MGERSAMSAGSRARATITVAPFFSENGDAS